MSVDMDVAGVMVAYLPVVRVCVCVCVLHILERHSLECATHTRTTGNYAVITHTTSISTGSDRTITAILAKHCIELPDDGSLVIRNMLEQFLNIL